LCNQHYYKRCDIYTTQNGCQIYNLGKIRWNNKIIKIMKLYMNSINIVVGQLNWCQNKISLIVILQVLQSFVSINWYYG
jgi:hypothetical protein